MRPGPSIRLFLCLPLCLAMLGLTSISCGDFIIPDSFKFTDSSNFTDSFNRAMEGAQRTPVWSSDGGWIVMNYGAKIYLVSSDGKHLREVAPLHEGGNKQADVSPSISPNGTQVAFSTLRHTHESDSIIRRDQEISMASREGGDYIRLTDDPATDTNPVWAPGGRQIAFVSTRESGNQVDEPSESVQRRQFYRNLLIINRDGSDSRFVTTDVRATLDLPAWSPDSLFLAFLLKENTEGQGVLQKALYTVRADGAGLKRLSRATVRPSWSPDGSRIAFGSSEVNETASIITVRPDGTDIQQVTKPGQFISVYNLSWSPDGSEIRFMAVRILPQGEIGYQQKVYGIHAIRPDGSGERLISDVGENQLAAWAPDDSRIAVFGEAHRDSRVQLYTIAPDGSDVRVLVRRGIGGIFAENSDWISTDFDLRACGEGFVVPEPENNPGLVRDCEALIKSRNALAGEEMPLLWNRNIPIADWVGVSVELDPPRVSGLRFDGELNGRIPPALGDLEELKILALDRSAGSIGPIALRGQIPSELGNLTKLEGLFLDGNQLSGTIPPELGNLVNLRSLNLRYNKLTGMIPPELGNLTNLAYLRISGNQLTGCIPDELRVLRPSNVSYDDWNRPC